MAGWNRTIQTAKSGGGVGAMTKAFFSSDAIRDEKNARKAANAEALAGKGIRKRAVAAEKANPGSGKMTAMKEIVKNNVPKFDAKGNKIGGLVAKEVGMVK